jgi:hypothetical protein
VLYWLEKPGASSAGLVYGWQAADWALQARVRLIRKRRVAMSSEVTGEAWVEDWAGRIRALGFSSGALLLIETFRAFGALGALALLLVKPLAAGLVNQVTLDRLSALLEQGDLLDRLESDLRREAA